MTIAGSDSGGGAGIQADLKTFAALGLFGTTVVTSITAQNTQGVIDIHDVPASIVRSQMRAVFDDFEIAAVKTGMLSTPEIVSTVARELNDRPEIPVVVDPVMVATSKASLVRTEAIEVIIRELIPRATLMTPNVYEASVLAGRPIRNLADMQDVAAPLLDLGAKWVLIKGGDLTGKEAVDLLAGPGERIELRSERVDTTSTHGTGCTFASAIAARIALGDNVPEAARNAKRFITEAIRHGLPIGAGHGPTDPFWFSPGWKP